MIQDNRIINVFAWSGAGTLPFPPTITIEPLVDPNYDVIGNYHIDGLSYYPSEMMNFEIDTNLTDENTTFKIPTIETGTYENITIDWGDGTIDSNINNWNDSKLLHTYENSGIYRIQIYIRVFNGLSFNLSNDKLKLINIEQFGAVDLGSTGDSFQGCSNLVSIDNGFLNTTNATNFINLFTDCASLKVFNNIGDWDISSLLNADEMFKNVDLSVQSYDALLSGWGSQTPQNNIIFDAGLSKYSTDDAEIKRNNLINNYGWTIKDGGKVT
jgi:hypothetical protein